MLYKFVTAKVTNPAIHPENWVGREGTIWIDSTVRTIRISDGVTPGGIIVSAASSGGGGGTAVTLKSLFDNTQSALWYYGEAEVTSLSSAPAWRIKQIVLDGIGNITSVKYAGDGLFSQIWNNRTALIYT